MRRDEEFADMLIRSTEALGNRRTLWLTTIVLGSLDLVCWIAVLFFSHSVRDAFLLVDDVSDQAAGAFIMMIFGMGLWLTYCIFRFRYPDLEVSPQLDDVFSSVTHQEHSLRRFHIWLVAVVGGVLNLLALAIVQGLRL
jgi:hypothetical protein